MGPLMSITSRSNLQSGWLPVRTAVATGTGGTTTCLVTVSEPVRQPPVQATGWTGVVDGDGVWLELAGAELAGAELDWPELGGAELVQAATLTATAASAVQSEAKAVVWRRIACSRYEICLDHRTEPPVLPHDTAASKGYPHSTFQSSLQARAKAVFESVVVEN